ncbi:hypothetical protein BBK82_18120 [Lentzea guizhouensis]|uniref:Uncharacterized protein n=1 Tax=Lentzea guizhouensis TaxID=1586287 RepID=A0A1B2HIY7_9PSEU|nr:hypothetical protein [Lentzea guizhouensis]ANZ37685.1 hypothetical protein BBK82_18120 [Lentzea guizhouensis]
MAAALLLSAVAVPAAQAETGFASVELTPTSGWLVQSNGTWNIRGGYAGGFAIDVTNQSAGDVDDLHLRISFPTDKLEVTGYEGDHWTCWDVAGGPGVEGVHCQADFLAVPQEAFPTLTLGTKGHQHHTDTLDVYAESGGHDEVHAGVAYKVDIST